MADELPESIHDKSSDAEIKQMLGDPEHGTWRHENGVGVFTPHASFLNKVNPVQLATFFHEYGSTHYRLNLSS
jgi:hypothetical protein